jgi:hypothetical protein
VRTIAKRSELGTPQPGPNGFTFDRDALVSSGRANLTAIERRLALLLEKPIPDSLSSQAGSVRKRKTEFMNRNRTTLTQLERILPPRFTIEQFNALTAPLQDAADAVLARLDDAMSQLAGQDCGLTSA